MASTFDDDFTDVATQFAELMGDTVTIQRGSKTTSAVTAQRFDGAGMVENEDGSITEIVYCEWIISVSAYTFTGLGAVEPNPGDRIIDSDGAEFECLPVMTLKQVELLPGGAEWMIRTKRVVT
jgi:hypothetical protein